jgi:hypothetical protein
MQKHRAAHRAYPENRFVPIKLIHIYPEPLWGAGDGIDNRLHLLLRQPEG